MMTVVDLVASLREERDFARSERDAYAHELAYVQQDLLHALARITELREELEAIYARGGV